jgi:hypothetical protein
MLPQCFGRFDIERSFSTLAADATAAMPISIIAQGA